MCGIAGILLAPRTADPRRSSDVAAMTASLRHRGPDGDGLWIDNDAGVALGHRRLAIVDLSDAGRQPMTSHGGDLVVTFNGEIYNFADLRSELDFLGNRFRGHSDTEVMLAAFERLGVEPALARFAGVFALGLWNRRTRVLHLVRDRLGKKPIYVMLVDGALVFASELKALRAFPGFRPILDLRSLALVLRQGWVPDEHCIWKGVFKIPHGGMLSVRADELREGGVDRLRQRTPIWWPLAEIAEAGRRNPLADEAPDLEAELERLLRVAVRERMVVTFPWERCCRVALTARS